MREICLLNKGDTVSKLSYSIGVDLNLKESSDTIKGYKYLTIEDGDNSIQIIRNYNPYFILNNVEKSNIGCLGFEIVACNNHYTICHKNSGVRYIVKPLETIDDICIKFDVDKEYIINTNNLSTTKLFVGQILII